MDIPQEVLLWQLGGKPGVVHADPQYHTNAGHNLLCRENNSYLTYGKRRYGINLVWTADTNIRKTHFRKRVGGSGPVLTGELLAFGIGGDPSFLDYESRPFGINLVYRSNPVFQWKIMTSSGKEGEPINAGDSLAIFNTEVKDFLVYFQREMPGINIGWTTSTEWNVKDELTRLAVEAAIKVLVQALAA